MNRAPTSGIFQTMDLDSLLAARGVSQRLSIAEAQAAIAAGLMNAQPAIERVALDEARGRRLAEDVRIGHALPPFANSAMDGYACRHADLVAGGTLRLVGASRAGARFNGSVHAGECVRIATGAEMPAGADTVVIQENAGREGDLVCVREVPAAGVHVRAAGEECAAGSLLLSRGALLDARALALAASAGRAELRVLARPRVAILTGGDELAPPGQALAPGQIHDSNASLLQALVEEAGGHALPASQAIADDPQRLLHALRRAAAAADLVLSTGGASVGDHDHLPRLLAEHGSVHFWRVRMKPGMPALFGELAGRPVLALPGNPVSVYATFRVLAAPAIAALQGLPPTPPARVRALLETPLRKRHARAEFLRAHHRIDEQGRLWARPFTQQESHRLVALAEATALVCLPEGEAELPAGAVVEIEVL